MHIKYISAYKCFNFIQKTLVSDVPSIKKRKSMMSFMKVTRGTKKAVGQGGS